MKRSAALWFLPVAGLLYFVGVLVRGEFVTPTADKAATFVAWAGDSAYPVSYALVSAAAILAIIGYVALDDLFGNAASRAAMVLAIAGAGFLLALFGVLWFGFTAAAQAGPGSIDVAVKAYSLSMPVQVLAGLNILGHIVFAVLLWRHGGLMRVGAVPFAVAPVLQALVVAYPVEIAGQALFLLGGLAIVWKAPRAESATGAVPQAG